MTSDGPSPPPTVLLAEDDAVFADRLRRNLELAGFRVTAESDGSAALSRLARQAFDLVVTDIRMPGVGGLELLRRLRSGEVDGADPETPVVVLTSVDSVATAVEAMKAGAGDYITKESDRQEVALRLRKVLVQRALTVENARLREQVARGDEFRDLIGDSPATLRIKEAIAEVAGQPVTVLVTGETGVGKELVARALHRTGPRPGGPFIDVNCAALPEDNLFQSELFGHEKGAFTGATELRRGRFEQAHRGTLFLDEVAELKAESQGKILKALEQQQVTRVGGSRPVLAECRFVFATNKHLPDEVAAGRFRDDLFYRINVFNIEVPPLRERRHDIPALARFFAGEFARRYGRPAVRFDEGALETLRDYPFPGNIRELRNVIERVVIRARGPVVSREQVAALGLAAGSPDRRAAVAAPVECAAPGLAETAPI